MALIVEGLACRRAGRRIFAGLGFRVETGGAAVLRGPNGSGKSTLLRALAGLLPAEAGSARLGDVRLSDAEAWRERVAYAGHLDAVKPALTARENLAGWAAFAGRPAADADAALERFGLAALADRPAGRLSAGQKRRLGLARLLVGRAPLWLLDEPTVSLDAASAAVLAEVVRERLAEGGVAVAATHAELGFGAETVVDLAAFATAPGAGPASPEDAPGAAPDSDDPFLRGDWA